MSTFGKKLEISLFGASHESAIGLTIHNFPDGLKVDFEHIEKRLKQRRGLIDLTSKRKEEDQFKIISGLFQGRTTGAPLTILIENTNQRSEEYERFYGLARPSHGDYVQYHKYQGHSDYRGGGTSSGRLSVALIVLGALSEQVLKSQGIFIASRIKSIHKIEDEDPVITSELLKKWHELDFPVYSKECKEKMLEKIKETREEGDSLGGVVETYIAALPVGLGEPFFDSLESILSHLIFSIPGVKGIEFGTGFSITSLYGSEANDQIVYQDAKIKYLSNHSGGINAGMANGNLVVFRTAFKPTPSISKKQQTINFLEKKNVEMELKGRHDTIIAIKGLHVVNALSYYAILELLR